MSDLTQDEAFLTLYADLAREGPGGVCRSGLGLVGRGHACRCAHLRCGLRVGGPIR